MNILITGYKGFIGQNMTQALHDRHHLRLYEWGEDHPTLEGLDWVIHLGAITSTTSQDTESIMQQNVDYSEWLLAECVKHRVNLQWASSASVYGDGTNFSETAAPRPLTPYAWSKYLFERHVRQQGPLPIRVQGFRYFNVHGPHEDHKGQQASPHHRFSQQAHTLGYVEVFQGSENYRRDFIHVSRVIELHQQFWRINLSGVWNFGTGRPRSFLDIAQEFGRPVCEIPMPRNLRPSYQSYTCADMTRTLHALGQIDK